MGWIAPLIEGLMTGITFVLKTLFGTSQPQNTTVEHTKPEIPTDGGKTDKEKVDDLGL